MNRSKLPEGWGIKSLSQVGGINPRYVMPSRWGSSHKVAFVPMASIDETFGQVRFFESKVLNEVTSGKTRFVQNDILFAKITPCTENGKVAMAEEIPSEVGFGSTEFHIIHPHDRVMPRFLLFYLRTSSVREAVTASMTGTTGRKRVPTSFMKNLNVPLPPLDEQHEIVAIIGQAEELRRLRAEADRLTEEILPSAFIEMFGDPRENPKGWETVKLGEIAEVTGGQPAPQDKSAFSPPEVPFVRMQDLGKYHRTLSLIKTTDSVSQEAIEKFGFKIFPKGSILVPRSGSVYKNHRAILRADAAVVSHIAILLSREESVLSPYLYAFLCFIDMSRWAKKTTGLDSITFKAIRDIDVPLPPLDGQKKFIGFIEELQVNQQRQAEAQQILDSLYQSLSAQAFTGELTALWREEQEALKVERQAVILALLFRLAQQNRRQVFITALMKYLFLLQVEGRAKGLYHFIPYKYGPFARQVYDDLNVLKERGLITVSAAATDPEKERTEISLRSDHGKEMEQLVQNLPEDVREDAEGIIDLYGELSLKELLDYVYAEYPGYAIRSEQ